MIPLHFFTVAPTPAPSADRAPAPAPAATPNRFAAALQHECELDFNIAYLRLRLAALALRRGHTRDLATGGIGAPTHLFALLSARAMELADVYDEWEFFAPNVEMRGGCNAAADVRLAAAALAFVRAARLLTCEQAAMIQAATTVAEVEREKATAEVRRLHAAMVEAAIGIGMGA